MQMRTSEPLGQNPIHLVPMSRYGHAVVAHGHLVYLFGGRNDKGACNKLYRFDTSKQPSVSPCVFIPSMDESRFVHTDLGKYDSRESMKSLIMPEGRSE